jgi:uncharacterized protein YndB with AHSA1/START domain
MPNPASTAVLRITRTFPAPRDRVFAAFTEPELLRQWWGPAGFSLPQASVDLRVGGRYRFEMQPPQGDLMYLVGTFREVKRPERLVYTWAWEGAPPESETVVTIEFREAEGDTEVLITQEPFNSDEARQQHVFGWEGGLDRLTEIFRREKRGKP